MSQDPTMPAKMIVNHLSSQNIPECMELKPRDSPDDPQDASTCVGGVGLEQICRAKQNAHNSPQDASTCVRAGS